MFWLYDAVQSQNTSIRSRMSDSGISPGWALVARVSPNFTGDVRPNTGPGTIPSVGVCVLGACVVPGCCVLGGACVVPGCCMLGGACVVPGCCVLGACVVPGCCVLGACVVPGCCVLGACVSFELFLLRFRTSHTIAPTTANKRTNPAPHNARVFWLRAPCLRFKWEIRAFAAMHVFSNPQKNFYGEKRPVQLSESDSAWTQEFSGLLPGASFLLEVKLRT